MTRLDDIRSRMQAATAGPWRWRGHDDGSVELRSPVDLGARIVSSMRSDPCIVEVGESYDSVSIELRPGACDPCRRYFAKADLADRDEPCAKPENLDTVWLWDQEHHWIRPANEWARREVPYRADVVDVAHPDAAFIAHARTDVPYLVAQVDVLTDALWTLYDELTTELQEPRDDVVTTLVREPGYHNALNRAAGALEVVGRLEAERAKVPA